MENQKKDLEIKDLIKKLDSFLNPNKPPDILIIKAHLLCEYYINQLLILRELCNAKELESLTFHEKILKAFDPSKEEDKQVFNYVKNLNRLRNKVGHELEYTLSESDVDTLGYLQGKEYILNKYDFETEIERLHHILVDIVIDTAIKLIHAVRVEKQKSQSEEKNTSTTNKTISTQKAEVIAPHSPSDKSKQNNP